MKQSIYLKIDKALFRQHFIQEFYFDSFVKFMAILLKYETFSTNRR